MREKKKSSLDHLKGSFKANGNIKGKRRKQEGGETCHGDEREGHTFLSILL